jgi:hypothetical protein
MYISTYIHHTFCIICKNNQYQYFSAKMYIALFSILIFQLSTSDDWGSWHAAHARTRTRTHTHAHAHTQNITYIWKSICHISGSLQLLQIICHLQCSQCPYFNNNIMCRRTRNKELGQSNRRKV